MKKASLFALIGMAILVAVDLYYIIINIIHNSKYLGANYYIPKFWGLLGYCCLLMYFVKLYNTIKRNK